MPRDSQRRALRPLQQIKDIRRLAPVAGNAGLLGGFGSFLRRAGLLGRPPLLGRNVRAVCANTGPFLGSRLLGSRLGGGFFCNRGHCDLLGRGFRDHMNGSSAPEKQVNYAKYHDRGTAGDSAAVPRPLAQNGTLMAGNGGKLGRKQEEAIAALLTQRNLEEAARAAGIGTRTLIRWLKLPEFGKEYRKARREAVQQSVARMQQATGAAASVVLKLMTGPNVPAAVSFGQPSAF